MPENLIKVKQKSLLYVSFLAFLTLDSAAETPIPPIGRAS